MHFREIFESPANESAGLSSFIFSADRLDTFLSSSKVQVCTVEKIQMGKLNCVVCVCSRERIIRQLLLRFVELALLSSIQISIPSKDFVLILQYYDSVAMDKSVEIDFRCLHTRTYAAHLLRSLPWVPQAQLKERRRGEEKRRERRISGLANCQPHFREHRI